MSAADEEEVEEERAAFDPGLLRRLLAFVRPHRGLLLWALLLFPPLTAAQLLQPWVLQQAVDGPVAGGRPAELPTWAGLLLALALVQAACALLQTALMQLAGQRVMRDVRLRLFDKVLRLSTAYFDRTPLGRTLTRLTSDVEALSELLSTNLVLVVADTVLLLGVVVVMLWLDWRLAAASLALVPALVAAVAGLRVRIRRAFRRTRDRHARLTAWLAESVAGVPVVQAFVRERGCADEHARRSAAWCESAQGGVLWSSLLSALVHVAQVLTLGLLLWAALRGLFGLDASPGLVVAFVDLVERFYAPIDNLSGRYATLQSALAAAEKIVRLLDEPDELPEPAAPAPLAPLSAGVALDAVDFRYRTAQDAEAPLSLAGVSLEVKRGTTLALVGATGAGKSTVARLLLRFHDPSAGAVRWDERDLRDVGSAALRARVAYVPQETFLFAGPLLDNVGLDRGRVPREKALAAAEAVGLDALAHDLPGGWDQVLGEAGRDLSAGERQLVAFARALAVDPELLVLDEATAAVDADSEARVQAALKRLLAGRTAVVVAHRLATIRDADRIVVLHKGHVREQGTHQELLALKGIYWTLWRLQSSPE